ncbi:hypothetical protein BDF14DRAFT_620207 [Spinellus fusiger]|nr:hypothetical protein BDF14DRAFT_620207 [Spinellus fusiger]
MDIKYLLCCPGESHTSMPVVYQKTPLEDMHMRCLSRESIYDQMKFWPHQYTMNTYHDIIDSNMHNTRKSRSESISSISSNSHQSTVSTVASPTTVLIVSEKKTSNSQKSYKKTKKDIRITSQPRVSRKERCESSQTRTPWSSLEDELLQKGYKQGFSWAMISSIYLPHRSRGCCWGRFKTLQSKNIIEVKYQQHKHHRFGRHLWKSVEMIRKSITPTN